MGSLSADQKVDERSRVLREEPLGAIAIHEPVVVLHEHRPAGADRIHHAQPFDAVRMIEREFARDDAAPVVRDHRTLVDVQRVHEMHDVERELRAVVAGCRRRRLAVAARVGREQTNSVAEVRRNAHPFMAGLGPAVDRDDRPPGPAFQVVHAQTRRVDETTLQTTPPQSRPFDRNITQSNSKSETHFMDFVALRSR